MNNLDLLWEGLYKTVDNNTETESDRDTILASCACLFQYAAGLERALELIGTPKPLSNIVGDFPPVSIIRTEYGDVTLSKGAESYLKNNPYLNRQAVIEEMTERATEIAREAFNNNQPIPKLDWP